MEWIQWYLDTKLDLKDNAVIWRLQRKKVNEKNSNIKKLSFYQNNSSKRNTDSSTHPVVSEEGIKRAREKRFTLHFICVSRKSFKVCYINEHATKIKMMTFKGKNAKN